MDYLKLDTPVQYIKHVGPVRAKQLAQLGIDTVEDLLLYFPFRFDLRKQVQPIDSIDTESPESVTIAGVVTSISGRAGRGTPYFQVQLEDDSAAIEVKWFHGGYLRDKIKEGIHLAVSSKPSVYRGHIQFVNPQFQILWDPEDMRLDRNELMPVYPAGGKITSPILSALIKQVGPQTGRLIPRWFRADYLASRGLMSRPQAVEAMHHPEDREHWSQARKRIAYDECLLMQLGIAIVRARQLSRPAHSLENSNLIDQRIRARFPFTLTEAQDKVISEIVADLAQSKPMNRLLQGDVGSGKTVVALYAALQAVAGGKQVAIMAPTEILAQQHFSKVRDYLSGSRVVVEILTGGQSRKRRGEILDKLIAGQIDIVVGTHALISKGVRFANLALVVVDEQHKFGVRQRTDIRGKGFAPHYLVMTATPIPRTLAMTVFGDLDISTIDTMPPGRGKTVTKCVGPDKLDDVLRFVAGKLRKGQQAYFIYPLVNPSATLALANAERAYRELADGPLKEFKLALIHGQMNSIQKQTAMDQFRNGGVQVLVASVVVEVGLDVPAANIMVIRHAERFGLAQLHQLRGRIGRGSENATCILVASPKTPTAKQRLDVLAETSDGFKVAEEDLRIRGPGQLFGTKQHGMWQLKVADLIEDFQLLRRARKDAQAIIAEDPLLDAPHHQQLRSELIKAYGGKLNLLEGA